MAGVFASEIARKRIVCRLDVVPGITRIHDEDPILSSLLLSTEKVDVEEELTMDLAPSILKMMDQKLNMSQGCLRQPSSFVCANAEYSKIGVVKETRNRSYK